MHEAYQKIYEESNATHEKQLAEQERMLYDLVADAIVFTSTTTAKNFSESWTQSLEESNSTWMDHVDQMEERLVERETRLLNKSKLRDEEWRGDCKARDKK